METFLELTRIRVAEAMHPGLITCPPETSLRTVARIMASHRVHCVIVFGVEEDEGEGHVWGIVSDLDLVAAIGPGLDDRTAGGTAASPLVTVEPGETLERAAQLMREYSTSHLVVVDQISERPLGVISTIDLAHAVSGLR